MLSLSKILAARATALHKRSRLAAANNGVGHVAGVMYVAHEWKIERSKEKRRELIPSRGDWIFLIKLQRVLHN